MDDVLDAMVGRVSDPEFAAYIFATVYHETGKKMVPVREGFAVSDRAARAAVKKLFDQKRISRNYADPINGISYYGRGRVQNTHLENYVKLQNRFGTEFVKNPDLLLDSKKDAVVTVVGHLEGIWTGKKLADFKTSNGLNYLACRRIVNGTDKADLIRKYAVEFEKAFRAAGFGSKTLAVSDPVPVQKQLVAPLATMPKVSELPNPPFPYQAQNVLTAGGGILPSTNPMPAGFDPDELEKSLNDVLDSAGPIPAKVEVTPTAPVVQVEHRSMWSRLGEFNKAFGAAKGGSKSTGVATIGTAIAVRAGWLPEWMNDPNLRSYAIVGVVLVVGIVVTIFATKHVVTAKPNTDPNKPK